jgi:hypothetical protein
MNSVFRFVTRALQLAMASIHLIEAADGGVSALVRSATLLDAFNRHDLHTGLIVLFFAIYDWARSGDNFAHAVACLRNKLTDAETN